MKKKKKRITDYEKGDFFNLIFFISKMGSFYIQSNIIFISKNHFVKLVKYRYYLDC